MPGAFRKLLGGLVTFHFVCFCWVFFRAQGLDNVHAVFSQIWYNFEPQYFMAFIEGYAGVVFWITLGFGLHLLPSTWEFQAEKLVTAMPLVAKAMLVMLIAALVMQVKSSEVQAFIYFQF